MDGDTMTTVYKFKAAFTKLGNATAPASAPTITIVDSGNNIIVSAQATTALSNMIGAYLYSHSGADDLDLVAKFTTTDLTMDAQDLFVTPQIAPADVWSYATRTITSGTITVTEIWDALLSGISTAGSVGKLIKDYIDAAVSTRATPADVTVNAVLAVAATAAASVSSGLLEIKSFYTMRQSVTSTTTSDLSGATKLWLSIKNSNLGDAYSLIFIEKIAGLTVVNKTTYATVANGSLTVTGESGAWNIAIFIDEVPTGLLNDYNGLVCDAEIKALISGDTIPVWSGKCRITSGIVQAVV